MSNLAPRMMLQLKRLSFVSVVPLAFVIGLVLAFCIGSFSFPWSGPIGALIGLFAFGLLLRLGFR